MKHLFIKFANPTASTQLTLADSNGFYKFEALRNYGEHTDSKRPIGMQKIPTEEFFGTSIKLADNSREIRVNAIKNFLAKQSTPSVASLDFLP